MCVCSCWFYIPTSMMPNTHLPHCLPAYCCSVGMYANTDNKKYLRERIWEKNILTKFQFSCLDPNVWINITLVSQIPHFPDPTRSDYLRENQPPILAASPDQPRLAIHPAANPPAAATTQQPRQRRRCCPGWLAKIHGDMGDPNWGTLLGKLPFMTYLPIQHADFP